ncbi:SIP domain-containing protein [uncultured Actinomyces sp.]|uniref:siderophore-interacting protein n=1 Tax=uncultured Actinomyces sp. TaxID=249061 RepID=UPI0028DBD4DA|nr:SIP domain-containing protein [uncultured Actinomyces sp.]
MGKGFQGAVLRLLGAKEHVVAVTGRTQLAEHFVRIHFRSDTLLSDGDLYPSAWIRLWFPNPDAPSTLHQRGYTLVDPDPQAGTFAIDFVLHHPMGPASYWASGCEAGEQLVAQRFGARPFALMDPPPAGYLLLGDLTSYPAITSIAATVPDDVPLVAYLERHHPLDETLPLPDGPAVTAAWVDELPDGQGLVQAVTGRDWSGWFAWIGAESRATRRAKSFLKREHGLGKDSLHAQAYWMRGRALGRSRTLDELNAAHDSEQ